MTATLQKGMVYHQQVVAPVTEQADVLVAGGGTAGCVAALAAARAGAQVLLVERQGFLGGMLTAGNAGMTKFTVHDGSPAEYRKLMGLLASDPADVQIVGGIPMEITRRLIAAGAAIGSYGQPGTYVFTAPEEFKWLLLELLEQAGARLLLHSSIVDVIKEGSHLRGVVIESKAGREVLLADKTIDCTGDGDVAARAGAPFILGVGPDDLAAKSGHPAGAMQAMGVMFRMANIDMARCFAYLQQNPQQVRLQPFALMGLEEAQASFHRGDMFTINIVGIGHGFQIYNSPLPGVFTFCCPQYYGNGLSNRDQTAGELTMVRTIRQRISEMREKLPGFEQAFLIDFPELCTRETRHVQGEYVLNFEDVLSSRAFPDGIGRGGHPIDIQPVPKELAGNALPPRWYFNIPYRSLVPREVDDLLLAGRCISATHEASGCTRPTVQCMITGEAAGVAAVMCVQGSIQPRDLNAGALCARLAAQGVIL
jgi:hypothetical protein